MSLEQQITEILKARPSMKGQEIATALGIDKRTINSCLHRSRGKLFVQDSAYRWKVARSDGKAQPTEPTTPAPETILAKLCRYYLDCLSQDGELDIGSFASGKYGLDYVELSSLPLVSDDLNVFENEAATRILNKTRRDRGRTVMYLGYPVRLHHLRSKSGWEGFKVEPVCVWTYQENPESPADWPVIADATPMFNFAVLRFLARTSGNFLDEAIQLNEELGIATASEDSPDLDEFFDRLRSVRPEWDWLEELDVYDVSQGSPLSELSEQGIYNRAILLVGERSPYTQGLETELGKLAKLQESEYSNTALGQWLSGNFVESKNQDQEPLVEVLPLNSEQRTAVHQGLSAPLTVITGPPGTGKSQVVTSLLISAAWRSNKVLFASKNNKAVDVVEIRCNSLGPRPILLRLGASEYQAKLAEYLDSLLSATATPADQTRFNERLAIHKRLRQRLQDLEKGWTDLIACRNRVDALEQQVEPLRNLLGESCFHRVRQSNPRQYVTAMGRLRTASERANPSHGLLARIFWLFVRAARIQELNAAIEGIRPLIPGLGLDTPTELLTESTIQAWTSFTQELDRGLQSISRLSEN